MNRTYLCIVLHAHLPYVHHPEFNGFYEENWLFNAITECYLPLANMLERLQADAVDYRLNLSLSPTLITLLRNPLLQQRYVEHLQKQIQFAEHEYQRLRHQPNRQQLADMYIDGFRSTLHHYRDLYQGDLVSAFLQHWRTGKLELLTTAATHGFLPLLNVNETAVRQQIKTGIECFRANTGVQPRGFWLPECGYYPGLEKLLKDYDIDYFFLESHGLLHAEPEPATGVYQPLFCQNGVAALARDPASSRQVWSADVGYPGHPFYREYYCDVGYELSAAQLTPFKYEENGVSTGIKYLRVSEKNAQKQLYQPQLALQQAREHAEHFMQQRSQQGQEIGQALNISPIIVAPYDAELFGHWWYEGPLWLEQVLRLSCQHAEVQSVCGAEAIDAQHSRIYAQPVASSWGEHGYAERWLNDSNAWIYPLLHQAQAALETLLGDIRHLNVNSLQQRALNQAMRSLLLAQASDWPFILKTGGHSDYARERIYDYLARFNYLLDAIRKNRIDAKYLAALEVMDDIFPELDFRHYPLTQPKQ